MTYKTYNNVHNFFRAIYLLSRDILRLTVCETYDHEANFRMLLGYSKLVIMACFVNEYHVFKIVEPYFIDIVSQNRDFKKFKLSFFFFFFLGYSKE